MTSRINVGNCLLWKGDDFWYEDYYKLFRILDVNNNCCEAYCYEIKNDEFYIDMTELSLPLSSNYVVIPVGLHDKITRIINDTRFSIKAILDNADTKAVSSFKEGDCFLFQAHESICICRINILMHDEYDEKKTLGITTAYYCDPHGVSRKRDCSFWKKEIIEDYQSLSVSTKLFEKIEKIFNIAQMTLPPLMSIS